MSEINNSQVANKNEHIEIDDDIADIQLGLSDLIQSINSFVNTQIKQEETTIYELTNDDNTAEKQDEPEKSLVKETDSDDSVDLCPTDEKPEIKEVDWSVAGPTIQRYVNDLEQLHGLNVATSSLILRIKKLAVAKSLNLLKENEENSTE